MKLVQKTGIYLGVWSYFKNEKKSKQINKTLLKKQIDTKI